MNYVQLSSLVIVAGLMMASGCDREPDLPEKQFAPDPDLPEAVVDLPSPPPASAFEIEKYNDDGSLRVEGLIGNRDDFLDEQVEVRGIVADITGHGCDPTVKACPVNRLFIRDHIDKDLQLRVVGYDDDLVDDVGIAEGEQYLFEGTYKTEADGFMAAETGLIVVDTVDGEYEVDPED